MCKRKWVFVFLLLTGLACAPTQTAYQQAYLRFAEVDPSILLVSLPDHLRLVTMHQTLTGPEETQLETTLKPIDLTETAAAWAPNLAAALQIFREVQFVHTGDATAHVRRLTADPRRLGRLGYRLLLPYQPPDPNRDPLAPEPPSENDLDDPEATECLLRVTVPGDNLPALRWYALTPSELSQKFSAPLLLLITMDHLTVTDTGQRPQVNYRLSAHLIDLKTPLLAISVGLELNGLDAAGPGSVEGALCNNLAELQADNWAALRRSFAPVGERYAYILATQFGWIEPARLLEQVQHWREENTRKLEND